MVGFSTGSVLIWPIKSRLLLVPAFQLLPRRKMMSCLHFHHGLSHSWACCRYCISQDDVWPWFPSMTEEVAYPPHLLRCRYKHRDLESTLGLWMARWECCLWASVYAGHAYAPGVHATPNAAVSKNKKWRQSGLFQRSCQQPRRQLTVCLLLTFDWLLVRQDWRGY